MANTRTGAWPGNPAGHVALLWLGKDNEDGADAKGDEDDHNDGDAAADDDTGAAEPAAADLGRNSLAMAVEKGVSGAKTRGAADDANGSDDDDC